MLIGPSHTLGDISREFQEMFPHTFLLFAEVTEAESSTALSYDCTIPEVGVRIEKEKEFPIHPGMTVGEFKSAFLTAYCLAVRICYAAPNNDTVFFDTEQQQESSLGELETTLARAGYLKYPLTDDAHVDESEKESMEDMFMRLAEEPQEAPVQQESPAQPVKKQSKIKKVILYTIGAAFLICAVLAVIGMLVE